MRRGETLRARSPHCRHRSSAREAAGRLPHCDPDVLAHCNRYSRIAGVNSAVVGGKRPLTHCRTAATSVRNPAMSKAPKIDPQEQARILVEALPHMQRYDEEIVVVKYGGHAMGQEQTARDFARDIVLLEQTAINPVVVHGEI